MEKLKALTATVLVTLVVLAGFGFTIIAAGFAIVIGGAVALAARLAGPQILAEAERRAADMRADMRAEAAKPVQPTEQAPA